jgi:surface protein
MFYDCKRLAYLDLSYLDTTSVTQYLNMFKYCSNLKNIKVNKDNYNTIERVLKWDNIYPEIEL